ncbi:Uncharacterised protein [Staphylococcus arlettae]|uniref:Uncharacterized protein n=1 Tax=Staphylococcus arlettae TaxID=29378 RepID=A0A380CD89_9STAP|nr:Uncharacterised protein [Staphylococcus arlettae]
MYESKKERGILSVLPTLFFVFVTQLIILSFSYVCFYTRDTLRID